MKSMAHRVALVRLVAFATELTGIASVGSRRAAYVGGTVTALASATSPVNGYIQTADESALVFDADAQPSLDQSIRIPYANVIDLEYGQKAGRRVSAAIGYSIVVGPAGLLALMSKKRHHYLTVGYTTDDGKAQVAVFEVGKDIVRTTLAIVQARSGKKIAYQDEDARRWESR